MDGVCKIQLLSTKRALYPAIFMDSKRLCTTVAPQEICRLQESCRVSSALL